MGRKKSARRIEVDTDNSESVAVRFDNRGQFEKMTEELNLLTDKRFKQIIRIAKAYRKTHARFEKFEGDTAGITLGGSNHSNLMSKMINVDNREFRQLLKTVRRHRKAYRMAQKCARELNQLDQNASMELQYV